MCFIYDAKRTGDFKRRAPDKIIGYKVYILTKCLYTEDLYLKSPVYPELKNGTINLESLRKCRGKLVSSDDFDGPYGYDIGFHIFRNKNTAKVYLKYTRAHYTGKYYIVPVYINKKDIISVGKYEFDTSKSIIVAKRMTMKISDFKIVINK